MLDALTSVYHTPTHLFTTQTGAVYGAEPQTHETTFTAKAIYVKSRNGWVKSSISPEEMAAQQQEDQAEAKSVSCHALREEAVDGEAATSDAIVWISKRSGRLLKEELDLDVGGKLGKTHSSTRFDYQNVQAPPGVN